MEIFFFIILAVIFLGFFGDGKKQKAKTKAGSILSPKNAQASPWQDAQQYPREWKNYEEAEHSQQEGMQDDMDPAVLFQLSKSRIERARKTAADKRSDNRQSYDAKSNNTQVSGTHVTHQPPLVRDMNMSRKLFLSGGRGNTFGERQKKKFGVKTILGAMALGVIGVYFIGTMSS